MKKFNITKNGTVCLYGRHLPEGAMYGEDEKGFWICTNYQMHTILDLGKKQLIYIAQKCGIQISPNLSYSNILRILKKESGLYKPAHYKKSWDKYGNLTKTLLSTEKCEPILFLLRPKKDSKANRIDWRYRPEWGPTVNKILELAERYPERVTIVRNMAASYKQTIILKDGKLRKHYVPLISNKEALAVAQNPDGRGIKEFMQNSRIWSPETPAKKECVITTGNYVNLEELAEKQRAERPATKPMPQNMNMPIYPQTSIKK